MNKDLFTEMLKDAPDTIDLAKLDKEIKRTMDENPVDIGHVGSRNLIIVIEELAELQGVMADIAVTYPKPDDKLHLQEELADVIMGMRYVQLICGIDMENAITEKPTVSIHIKNTAEFRNISKPLLRGQMALTKYLRGKQDITKDMLRDIITDILAACRIIKIAYCISDEDINKAINVKLKRLENTEHIYM